VRVVADEQDPRATPLKQICSSELRLVGPEDSIDDAIAIMREHAVRRLPVVEDGQPVGIVSIGDFAQDRDERSALADISSATPNQ
jgi:CBS domain-containing protein